MDEKTFRRVLTKVHAIFDRKVPPETTCMAWWEELRHIPDEAAVDITDMIKDLETFPRNFPATFKGFWRAWLDHHPEKRAYETAGCGRCDRGYWTLSRWVESWRTRTSEGVVDMDVGTWASFVVPCPYCSGGKLREHELIERGFCRPHTAAASSYHAAFPDHGFVRPEPVPGNITTEDIPF